MDRAVPYLEVIGVKEAGVALGTEQGYGKAQRVVNRGEVGVRVA